MLHGIPYGVKDIIAASGYPTRWGARPLAEQTFERDATVVERLREAGAVLVAKLTTGELAFGDQWAGGRTNNPWNLEQGSSGSSAGSAAATAAGLVAFAIGIRYRRVDSFPGRALRDRRAAADLRPRQPRRRDDGGQHARQDRTDVPARPGLHDRAARDRRTRRARSRRARCHAHLVGRHARPLSETRRLRAGLARRRDQCRPARQRRPRA